MLLKPTPICSSTFTYKNQTFVSELSMMKGIEFTRVYDDAADFGFSIISKKTGKAAVFALHKYDYDGEGDLVALHFNCVTPGLKNLKAVIFND